MKLSTRRVSGCYTELTVEHNDTTLNTGLLEDEEVWDLIDNLQDVITDLIYQARENAA